MYKITLLKTITKEPSVYTGINFLIYGVYNKKLIFIAIRQTS
jgi:hypothetical protein